MIYGTMRMGGAGVKSVFLFGPYAKAEKDDVIKALKAKFDADKDLCEVMVRPTEKKFWVQVMYTDGRKYEGDLGKQLEAAVEGAVEK